jgi:hypothetical protein
MPTEDPWNKAALIELTTREPFQILKASVQMICLLKSRGILPPGELRQSLRLRSPAQSVLSALAGIPRCPSGPPPGGLGTIRDQERAARQA